MNWKKNSKMTTGRFSRFFFLTTKRLYLVHEQRLWNSQQFVLSITAHSHFPFQQSGVSLTRCPPLCALTIIFRLWRWCHYVGGRLPHSFCLPSFPPYLKETSVKITTSDNNDVFSRQGGAPRQGSESSNSTRVMGYFFFWKGRKEGRQKLWLDDKGDK